MKSKKSIKVAAPRATDRAALTSLPNEVLEMIVNHLPSTDKSHLAMCCKATLPIICMGHVSVWMDERKCKRPLLKATRCLTKQPGGVSRLSVFSLDFFPKNNTRLSTRHLIELSLLSNLRKLNLIRVAVSLPALQPVATRLRELNLDGSCLQGSANGFLTRGWTALTTLSLEHARMETATMTAALSLPALEEMDMNGFRHQGGELQLDQLIDGCPHVRGFSFQLEDCVMQGSSGPYCSLLGLGRLTDLSVWTLLDPHHETLDLDLPAGLTRLSFDASRSEGELDFFWALNEAARCIGRGARLRKLVCTDTEADRQPAQWRLSLEEQYRRLGGRLTSLHELEVVGDAGVLLAALGAVVSAAPSLTCARLTINATEPLPRLELPPICSASLKSITVGVDMLSEGGPPLPPLVLTFLPGCTRLREVVVRIGEYAPTSGTAVKIRCHACSSACIAPMDVKASGDSARIHDFDGPFSEMGVRLLPGPPSPQGVQSHTVIYACHAAGPQQPLVWSHAVMPGFL